MFLLLRLAVNIRNKGVGEMHKKWIGLFVCAFFLLALSACGEKSQQDVTDALDAKVQEMAGYKSDAKMTLNTGKDAQVYDVEIWHSKPMYYRVNLKNTKKDQSQMILRNDEGVFVLTPALNKSFRFQSDWPQNSSQAYLYESLVQDIVKDEKASFKSTDKHYIFETKTNYQNSTMLPKQEITLNKSDLAPVSVKIMDTDNKVLIKVDFSKVKFDSKFDKGAFDTKRNMTSAKIDVPTLAQQKSFSVLYPKDVPKGTKLSKEKKIETENGERVVLMYKGEKPFTLVQGKAQVAKTATSTVTAGEPFDLGFTVGALTDKSLSWTYNGVDFMLASDQLTPDELSTVARSVQSQMGK
ncbi:MULTISPECIES: LolA family protein [Priestia]|uniref:LolA family protein n=1 Tax=Priestia TaxID=2800373 RepID=UPI0018A27D57|nr:MULTISPECIES: outer membrane lipoprotein carrier protein LolA [Priestia]QTL49787.1 outer membrane lipoprotein carrier protein LolA [Priestia aryabhattai]USL42748.1 outer membrane lipoprotein carrier protein LolA [Priestia megaterium]